MFSSYHRVACKMYYAEIVMICCKEGYVQYMSDPDRDDQNCTAIRLQQLRTTIAIFYFLRYGFAGFECYVSFLTAHSLVRRMFYRIPRHEQIHINLKLLLVP